MGNSNSNKKPKPMPKSSSMYEQQTSHNQLHGIPKSKTTNSLFIKCFNNNNSNGENYNNLPPAVHSPNQQCSTTTKRAPVLTRLFKKSKKQPERPKSCPLDDSPVLEEDSERQNRLPPRSETNQDILTINPINTGSDYDVLNDKFLVDLNSRLLATIEEKTSAKGAKTMRALKSSSVVKTSQTVSKFTKSPAMFNITATDSSARISDLLANRAADSASTQTYEDDDNEDTIAGKNYKGEGEETQNLLGGQNDDFDDETSSSLSTFSSVSVSTQSSLSLNTTPPSRNIAENGQMIVEESEEEQDRDIQPLSLMMMTRRFEERVRPPPIPPRDPQIDQETVVFEPVEVRRVQSLSEGLNFIDEDPSVVLSDESRSSASCSSASSICNLNQIAVSDEPEQQIVEESNRAHADNFQRSLLRRFNIFNQINKRLRGLLTNMTNSRSFNVDKLNVAESGDKRVSITSIKNTGGVHVPHRPHTPTPPRRFSTNYSQFKSDNDELQMLREDIFLFNNQHSLSQLGNHRKQLTVDVLGKNNNNNYSNTNEDNLSLCSLGPLGPFNPRKMNVDAPLALSENTTLTSNSYANLVFDRQAALLMRRVSRGGMVQQLHAQ